MVQAELSPIRAAAPFDTIFSVNRNKPHNNYLSLFCHEIGHTRGFGHPGSLNSDATPAEKTCMRSSPDVTTYSDNDRFWINWFY